MKLTDKVIQNAKPKDKEFALHDCLADWLCLC